MSDAASAEIDDTPVLQATTWGMRLRGWVPGMAVPAIVGLRLRRRLGNAAHLEAAHAEMEHLIGAVRPDDVERAARAYVARQVWRSELRYQGRIINRQPISGLHHLQEAQATGRGVVLSFLHHGHYEGAVSSVAGAGTILDVMVAPQMVAPDAPAWLKQHLRVGTATGNRVFKADAGAGAALARLAAGRVIAVATDVPGSTVVEFLGRPRRASSGAVRLAATARSLIVPMYATGSNDGLALTIGEALDPSDFGSIEELQMMVLGRHEAAVLAWPEAYDSPTLRWGHVD